MSDLQESYTYDVPMCNFDDDDNNVDSWFDQVADAENVPPQSVLTTENPESENIAQSENVVSNKQTLKTKARRSSKRLSAQQRNRQMAKIRAERRTVPLKQEQPPMKKPKLSSAKCKSTETAINKGLATSVEVSPKLRTKVNLPSTPTVLKRKHFAQKAKNTEEQELEKVQQLQQEMAERLKKNEESLKSVLAGDQPLKRVPIQATKPVDFHFHTDDRLKRHPNEQATEYKQVDFTAELRKHPPSPAGKLGRTVPKPFNLSKSNKRKLEETTAEYTSTAEQVLAFQKRTPQRFHLRSRQRELEGPSPMKQLKARMTVPKTPQLQTKQRHRPTTCKSSAEIEAEELDQLQQYKFKAQELNPKVLEGGQVLPRKLVKEPTKAVGFNLEIEKRIQQREKKDEEHEEMFIFHSRPCPTKMLQDVVGVPAKKMHPVTMPQSPAFALKNRIRMQSSEEPKEEPVPVIKANPMPYFGVPFKPKLVEQKPVEACPFSFNERDRQRMDDTARKLEELRNAEPPKFKAQPLPDFDHISLPEKKVKERTQPEPFNLELDKRGETRHQVWKHQIEEQLKQQKEMSMFKARPNTVTHQEPFVPKKESRILTESLSGSIVQEGFELATERRAKERQEFEKRLAELETQKSLMEEEERKRHEEEEKEEINRLRQEVVHKAQPVRKFKPVEVKASDLPLTVPKSPKFSDRLKI